MKPLDLVRTPVRKFLSRGALYEHFWDDCLSISARIAVCSLAGLSVDDNPSMRWLDLRSNDRALILLAFARVGRLGNLCMSVLLGEFDSSAPSPHKIV